MKDLKEPAFLAICLCFSALLLIGSLLYGVRLAEVNDRAAACMESAERLRDENRRLRVQCACSLSLEEIERYAEEELGMQHLSGEQIVVVEEPVR